MASRRLQPAEGGRAAGHQELPLRAGTDLRRCFRTAAKINATHQPTSRQRKLPESNLLPRTLLSELFQLPLELLDLPLLAANLLVALVQFLAQGFDVGGESFGLFGEQAGFRR